MNRRPATHTKLSLICLLTCFCGVWLGTTCAGGGNNEPPLNPDVPVGNRPPRATITSVVTPSNDNFAEQGELVSISYSADDGENQITLRIFASRKQTNVTPADEIPIASGIFLGPTEGTGTVVWNTAGVAIGTYYIFAEVNDGVNPPVRVTAASSIQIAPPGSRPQNAPPQLSFFLPISNMGLSSQDEVSVVYAYTDPDDSVTVTLLLDKDQDPSNDNIANPGDPLDPNSRIIILPSTARKNTDPTFDGDPAPPDDPANPPVTADSLQIRTNPRTLDKTTPGQPEVKEYRFTIDFAQIPVRNEPYYLRGTIKDSKSTIHRYAQGSITITSLASGVVDVAKVGFGIAGARWTGFGTGENLGSTFIANFDLDTDTNGDFLIGSRFASPRNRFQSGAAYLIFGRRKAPFPPDVDGDGRPGGTIIDSTTGATDNFPPAPPFVSNPYAPAFVGRFGGAQNINSVSSLYRGTTIGMPEPHTANLPPQSLRDPDHPNRPTSGLMSMARVDMNNDGTPDLIFGVPFVSTAYDYHDDDPVDGGCDLEYSDGLPNGEGCDTGGGLGRGSPNDDITSARYKNPLEDIDQGLVLVLDGQNNINTTFRLFLDAAMAGQNDPAGPIDDEGVNIFATVPNGMRFRGGWLASAITIPIVSDNQYGRTVAGIPSIDNDGRDELLISVPGFESNRGMIQVWLSNDFIGGGFYGQAVRSLPSYVPIGCTQGQPTSCVRTFVTLPVHVELLGANAGDEFGYASSGGHFNQDGTADILCGAPGADTQAIINGSPAGPVLTDNGIFYVLFTPSGGFGNTDLGTENPPRVEIRGTHNGDRFGEIQSEVADMNGDGLTDVAFASQTMDDDVRGNPDAGYVGIIFGFRPLTGENGFSPDQVGTPQLPGVRFFGATTGARAGASISTAGEFDVPTLVNGQVQLPRDFNNDGYGDLLISSPGEIRNVNVGDTNGDGVDEIQARTGVAYLVFGGTHLINKSFSLSQVGSPDLPGIVFISRFVTGSQDEAPLETVSGLGDIDGDGFVDVILGCPKADFVDPLSPNQRRDQAGEVYIIYGNNFGSNRIP